MNENVIMLICYLIAPVIFIIVGLLLWRFPPQYGEAFGYKTKLAYSCNEAWNYAQVFFGRICTLSNIPVLAITVVVGIYQVIKNVDETQGLIICLILTAFQVIPLVVCILVTEARLKKYFGESKK